MERFGWVAACVLALAGSGAWAPAHSGEAAGLGAEARELLHWIAASGDAAGKPYAVVDKKRARILVYDAAGALRGESAALLGATIGDHTVPGVGDRAQSGQVRADERTTPAGRFEAAPGHNLQGEHVVWADYASAFAIHRVRPGRSLAARLAGLASPQPEHKRLSLGCVVVPVAFYEQVIEPVLGRRASVVYVLPEVSNLKELFGSL
jgi:hypothetical protein